MADHSILWWNTMKINDYVLDVVQDAALEALVFRQVMDGKSVCAD